MIIIIMMISMVQQKRSTLHMTVSVNMVKLQFTK